MKWIVGLDLRPSSYGALHFATWLAAEGRTGDDERFVGVQVLEQEHLMAELHLRHLDEVTSAARAAARDILVQEGAAGVVREVEVLQAVYADEGLEAAREHYGADAVIIGRAATRGGARVIRLGRVARRALRRVWSPIIVVPPDVREADVGEGPVVALTRLSDESVPACRFASRLARAVGRPLALLHVQPPSSRFAATASPPLARPEEAAARLRDWSESEGLRPSTSVVLHGHVVERALEFAEAQRAPLVVIEARPPSALEQVLGRRPSTALAALSPLAVAVVPSRGARSR